MTDSNKWALYSARKSNKNWGFGNFVLRAGVRLGWEWVLDCDYRLEDRTQGFHLDADVRHLILKGERFTPDDLRALKGKVGLWYPDQVTGFPDRQRKIRELSPLLDHIFVSCFEEMSFYEDLVPQEKLTFLPSAWCPEIHYSRGGVRDIDVGHVGNISPKSGRPAYLDHFEKAGLPIQVRKVYGDEMMEFYSRCKIVWNLGWDSSGIQTRFWEAMGAEALVVTNETTGNARSPFIPGVHMVTYKDRDDAVDKCRYYLEHEAERLQIVHAASEKIRTESIDNRLKQIDEKLLLEHREIF